MISVHSRYKNNALHQMMREFIPPHIPVHAHDGFNHYTCALWYLVHVIMTAETPYIVSVDEDCFIYDWEEVEAIVSDMDALEIAIAGMPDAKEYQFGRDNSDKVLNPFFLIINTAAARKIIGRMNVYELLSNPDGCRYDEPFNALMVAITDSLKTLPISTNTLDDGITTDLGFAYHTWYSREYGYDHAHTDRINAVYHKAKDKIHG
jgi:hypothetical protein